MKKPSNLPISIYIGIIYFAAFLLYFFVRNQFAFDLGDEGYTYYLADAFGKGLLPYHDVKLYNYLPTLFYIYSPVFILMGPDIDAARTFTAVFMAITPVLFFLTIRNFVPRNLALALTVFEIFLVGSWVRFYINLLNILVLFVLVQLHKNWSPGIAIVYGAVLGLVTILRIDIACLSIGLTLLLFFFHRHHVSHRWPYIAMHVLLGMVLILIPFGVFLYSKDIGAGFIQQYLGFFSRIGARAAISSIPFPQITSYFGVVFWGSLIPISIFFIVFFDKNLRSKVDLALWALCFLWVLGNLPQFLFERRDMTHLLDHSAAILLAWGLFIYVLFSLVNIRKTYRALMMLLMSGYFLIFLMGGYFFIFLVQSPLVNIIRNPADSTIVSLDNGQRAPGIGHLKQVFDLVIMNSNDKSLVASYPYSPGINFLLQRMMSGRHVYLIYRYMNAEVEKEAIQDVAKVCWLFYDADLNIDANPKGNPKDYMPDLHNFIMANFHLVAVAQPLRLFRRNDCSEIEQG